MPLFIIRPKTVAASELSAADLDVLRVQRLEELEVLEATYLPDVRLLLSTTENTLTPIGLTLSVGPFEITIRVSSLYPLEAPLVELCLLRKDVIPRLYLYELQFRLQELISDHEEEVKIDVSKISVNSCLAGRLCEEVMDFASEWREDGDDYEHTMECECSECNLEDALYHDDLALRAFVNECLGGESPVSIASKITQGVKLLHWEYVARLVARFRRKRDLLGKAAAFGNSRRQRDEQVTKMTRVRLSYHGSPRRNVLPIINGGFVIPGKKNVLGEKVEVRCGQTWGRGIYSSPDPNYCLPYSDWTYGQTGGQRVLPGLKIIVCAVLLGNQYKFQSRNYREGPPGIALDYDSHISPSGLEWIVFEESQIVPIIVLHLGDAKDLSQPNHISTSVPKTLKEMLLASRKNLPFGFGPAGSRCVVKDIGETDEDDENWGDYQQRDDEFSMDDMIRERKELRRGW